MARVTSVLKALWTAIRRDGQSVGATGNNFFLVAAAFLLLGDKGAFLSLGSAVIAVLFFPLSADPLRKIPADRLKLWPLTTKDRWLLRVLSPWLNPITWLLAALALWRGVAISLWLVIAAMFVAVFALPLLIPNLTHQRTRLMSNFPGPLNQLIRKNLRQFLSTLDFYCALIWTLIGSLARIRSLLPTEAHVPMSMLVVLALSTIALNLFGADGKAGMDRYRLMPISGWQILIAKDAAFLLIVLLLTAPLSPIAGIAAALVGLAIGHNDSIKHRRDQPRWRFTTSPSFGSSIFQVIVMISGGVSAATGSPLCAAACIVIYAASLWWYGRALERQ